MKISSHNLRFKIFGVSFGISLLIATIFTYVYAFLDIGKQIVAYYVVATIFQIATLILLYFFVFYKDGLFSYWKQWKQSDGKPFIFYPFIASLFAGFACFFAFLAGLIDQGWMIVAGYSTIITAASWILEIAVVAGGIPSVILLPLWFDRNKQKK